MAISADALRQATLVTERSWTAFNVGLHEYQDAARRNDWDIIEDKRMQTMTALESFLDGIASAHRLMGHNGGQ